MCALEIECKPPFQLPGACAARNKPELNSYVGKAEIVIRPREKHLYLFGQLL